MLPGGEKRAFYAIGGTWRSLARLQMRQKGYPLHVTHQYAIEAGEAADFCRMVARRDVDSLDSIEVVSRNRRPLLPYGAAVLEQVIRIMKPSRIVMSALGVREGHLYDLLSAEEKARDPLIVACEELAWLRSRSPRHAARTAPVVGAGFRRRSASTRPRRRRGSATPPACSPTSAGGSIPNIAASRAST